MYDCGGGPRHNYVHTASLLAKVIACLSFNIWNIDFQLSTRRTATVTERPVSRICIVICNKKSNEPDSYYAAEREREAEFTGSLVF